MHPPILIVEDEPNLGKTLKDYLGERGFKSYLAVTSKSAKELFLEISPFLAIIDIGLPDESGLELAKYLRNLRKDFYFLFLSALNDPSTRVQGLELGAEDYISKPFALKELLMRLNRTLNYRKENLVLPEEIKCGKLVIKFKSFEVLDAKGIPHPLTQKECGILQILYKNKNKAVERNEIIDHVWGQEFYPSSRTIDNYIVKLRKWAETDGTSSLSIKSIRGIGYKLEINDSKLVI
jgi:two-component system, OmpR family, alkaline phosphatase synthesis response regulator PhoP